MARWLAMTGAVSALAGLAVMPGAAAHAQARHAPAVARPGTSPGTFRGAVYVPAPAYPADVAIAGVTGNGRNDLVIAGGMGSRQNYLWMYPQERDGRLGAPQKITIGSQLTDEYAMVVADLYGNRRREVMLTAPGKILVYTPDRGRLTGPGSITIPTFTNNFAVADVNHDGHPDIVAANGGTSSVTVYYGSASHHFSRGPTLHYSHGGVWYTPVHTTDLGAPGRTDIAFYDGVTMDVRLQQRNDSYGPVTSYKVVPARGVAFPDDGSAALGDLTGDGRPDLVLPNQGNRPWSAVEVFPDKPDGRLGAPAIYPTLDIPGPMSIADLTGNGRKDLVVQHESWEHVGIMMQQADGRLSPEVLYPVTDCCDGPFSQPAVGDLNGDGRPDIAVAAGQAGVAILYQI
jgi:FG-GAP-like repeat